MSATKELVTNGPLREGIENLGLTVLDVHLFLRLAVSLTPSEWKMFELMEKGTRHADASRAMKLTYKSGEKHRYNLMEKLNATVPQAVRYWAVWAFLEPFGARKDLERLKKQLDKEKADGQQAHAAGTTGSAAGGKAASHAHVPAL